MAKADSRRAASTRARRAIIAVGLLALVLATFSGVAGAGFLNYDDPDYITENPHVREGITGDGVRWAMSSLFAANWHPLTWVSHMVDVELFGLAPGPHHLMSVAYHGLATLLLFGALARLCGGTKEAIQRAAAVAALFAVHPLHVESVAWIAERKDVLSTTFWMATLIVYARYIERPRTGRYLLVCAGLVLGLAAKPMLVTLPFVLLLLDFWPLGRWTNGTRRRIIIEKLPLIGLAAASSAITVVAQRSAGAVRDVAAIGFVDRIANAAISYWTYLAKAVWPVNLAAFYPFGSPSLAIAVLAAGGLVAVSALVFIKRRSVPFVFVGWFWYVGTLVPVIGLVQVGNQAMADRYTYVPLIGIFVAIAWGLPELLRRWQTPRLILPVATAIVVAVLVPVARAQVATWHDSETLWKHAVAATEDNYFAHGALGAALEARQDHDGAEREFEAALRLKPDLADVHNDLGSQLAARGRLDAALPHFRQAVALDPRFAEARHNLGMALWQTAAVPEAITQFSEALRINPDLPRTHTALGRILAANGRIADALPHFLAAARLAPDALEMQYNAALALATVGRKDEARLYLRAALALDPRHGPSLELQKQLSLKDY